MKIPMLIWPFAVALLGFLFHRKQNSKDPWTGGPISWPKSFWLANAIVSWFVHPLILILIPNLPDDLRLFLLLHLVSWWTRGLLELFMIYKWLNWSPKYGITHDLCQTVSYVVTLAWAFSHTPENGFEFYFVFSYGIYILIEMAFEVSFARLFLQARTDLEAQENVYFASDDPKWLFVNRLTLTAVIFSFAYGTAQGLVFWFLANPG